MSVCAAVTARLLAAGYENIFLLTDDFRLPAISIYLRLSYQPLLHAPDMAERWRVVYEQLGRTDFAGKTEDDGRTTNEMDG